jgi:hypothetical protein
MRTAVRGLHRAALDRSAALLRSVAEAGLRWSDAAAARAGSGSTAPDGAPIAGFDATRLAAPTGPPAPPPDWVERVRRHAPHLLEPPQRDPAATRGRPVGDATASPADEAAAHTGRPEQRTALVRRLRAAVHIPRSNAARGPEPVPQAAEAPVPSAAAAPSAMAAAGPPDSEPRPGAVPGHAPSVPPSPGAAVQHDAALRSGDGLTAPPRDAPDAAASRTGTIDTTGPVPLPPVRSSAQPVTREGSERDGEPGRRDRAVRRTEPRLRQAAPVLVSDPLLDPLPDPLRVTGPPARTPAVRIVSAGPALRSPRYGAARSIADGEAPPWPDASDAGDRAVTGWQAPPLPEGNPAGYPSAPSPYGLDGQSLDGQWLDGADSDICGRWPTLPDTDAPPLDAATGPLAAAAARDRLEQAQRLDAEQDRWPS